MDDDAALAALTADLEPIVTDPGTLIAQGRMPQVMYKGEPYRKTERGPAGWDRVLRRATNTIAAAGETITTVTPRLVAVERGREWYDHDDPDRPQTPIDRLALVGMAATEEGAATHWLVVHESVGRFVESGSWTTDREKALLAYETMEIVMTESLEARRADRT